MKDVCVPLRQSYLTDICTHLVQILHLTCKLKKIKKLRPVIHRDNIFLPQGVLGEKGGEWVVRAR